MKLPLEGITWDENEAEQIELEHFGDDTINNSLVTVKSGIHSKLKWDENEAEQTELEYIDDATINNYQVTVKTGIHLK